MSTESGKKISVLGFVLIFVSTVILTLMSAMLNITGYMGEGPLSFDTIFTLFTVGDVIGVCGYLGAAAGFFFIYNEEREIQYLLVSGGLLIPAFYSVLLILGVNISFGSTQVANMIGNIIINIFLEAYLVFIAFSALKKRNIIVTGLLALAYVYKTVGVTIINNLIFSKVNEGIMSFVTVFSMTSVFSMIVSFGVLVVCSIHALKDL